MNFLKTYSNGTNFNDKLFDIPENSFKMYFQLGLRNYSTGIYEIQPYNAPSYQITSVYPLLKENGVVQGYNNVEINYYSTAVQKLYKINDGEWQNYQNRAIKLNLEDVLYSKSIDKNNVESMTATYKSVLPDDALGINAYDGDESTGESGGSGYLRKYIYIDDSMIGKGLSMKATSSSADKLIVKIYDEDNNELLSRTYSSAINLNNKLFDIPENSYKIYIDLSFRNYATSLYEIQSYNES